MRKGSKFMILGILLFLFALIMTFLLGSRLSIPYVPSLVGIIVLASICSFLYGLVILKRGESNKNLRNYDSKLSNKKIIIGAIILGIICFGGIIFFNNNADLPTINSLDSDAIVDGNGVAEGDINIDCGKPQQTWFYSSSSPGNYEHEFTISGKGTITLDLSKINWRTINVGDGGYNVNSSNVNVSIEDYFKTAVNNTLNSDKFQLNLDIPGLDELDYGGQMMASEPTDEQSRALDQWGTTTVGTYRESLNVNGYIESYSLDGNILTINVDIPEGYGYITSSNVVKVDNKNATLDLTVSYNNVTYNIGFNDLKVKYNT